MNKIRSKLTEKVHAQKNINLKVEANIFEEYTYQLFMSMVTLEIIPFPKHEMVPLEELKKRNDAINSNADKYRHLTTSFSWIPISEWT